MIVVSWIVLFVLVIVCAIVFFFIFANVFTSGEKLEPMESTPDVIANNRAAVAAGDMEAIRFDTIKRGYRPEQVDALIVDLLATIDELRAKSPGYSHLRPSRAAEPTRAEFPDI